MSAATLSPAQGVLDLVHSLGRAEWGPLAGPEWRSARAVLDALGRMMWDARSDRRGTVTTTARQVAHQAGYGERWTRSTLQVMEDLGVIEWHRGGVEDGTPKPSIIRVVKARLVEWIRLARSRHDEAERRRRDECARRLRRLRFLRLAPRLPRSVHAALPASLPPQGGRRGAQPAAPTTTPTPQEGPDMRYRRRGPDPDPKWLPVRCHHGVGTPMGCRYCRYEAWQAQRNATETITYHATPPKPTPEPQPTVLPLSPFDQYMDEHYPDLDGPARARAALADPRAKELARG